MSTPPPIPPQQPQTIGYASPYADPTAIHCPKCQAQAAKPVQFTWWGGLIGPKILSHTACKASGYTINRKTGKPNTTAIVIYFLVTGALVGVLAFYAYSR